VASVAGRGDMRSLLVIGKREQRTLTLKRLFDTIIETID
jgi:hypothetical protein